MTDEELLELAKAARAAYLPNMDNWDKLKPSAIQSWVNVVKAVLEHCPAN